MNPFLELEALTVNIGAKKILKNIDLVWELDQQWALVGPSGSGKTVLAQTLAGRHFYSGKIISSSIDPERLGQNVSLVEQQHRFKNIFNRSDFYYQQRYNASEAEDTITVLEALQSFQVAGSPLVDEFCRDELIDLLRLRPLLDEPLIQLSNGENKRLQLLEALLSRKKILILDQPFTGLDADGRTMIHTILNTLSGRDQKMMIICSAREIPDFVTHVAELNEGAIEKPEPRSSYRFSSRSPGEQGSANGFFSGEKTDPAENDFEFAVRMSDVHVKYGEKAILENIYWEVRRGEQWSLSGPNGAGKSTLLSLITGDNPQAYANEIYLFDRRRGTGESIWDIKKRIGYVSPELHLYFDPAVTCSETVASGFFDSIGLFRALTAEQEQQVDSILMDLSISHQGNKRLSALSLGEQRLALLGRALVKIPPLLILDEPCQGLDDEQTDFFRTMVEQYCARFGTTLIYISHYPQELPASINRFLRLEKGRLAIPPNGHQHT